MVEVQVLSRDLIPLAAGGLLQQPIVAAQQEIPAAVRASIADHHKDPLLRTQLITIGEALPIRLPEEAVQRRVGPDHLPEIRALTLVRLEGLHPGQVGAGGLIPLLSGQHRDPPPGIQGVTLIHQEGHRQVQAGIVGLILHRNEQHPGHPPEIPERIPDRNSEVPVLPVEQEPIPLLRRIHRDLLGTPERITDQNGHPGQVGQERIAGRNGRHPGVQKALVAIPDRKEGLLQPGRPLHPGVRLRVLHHPDHLQEALGADKSYQ